MSSNAYTLKIAIDDSKIKDLEKRLMAIMSGNALGGANPLIPQGGGSDKSGMMKNIGKLGMIATGIAGIVMMVQKIVSMTVSASPMLQQMLKLFNFSIMLILRPIGDFFGFFLRPIVVYFLRSVALPFYRTFRPIMIGLGTWLGNQGVKNLQSNVEGAGAIIAGDWDKVGEEAKKGTDKLIEDITWWTDGFHEKIRSMPPEDIDTETPFDNITDFFDLIGLGFQTQFSNATTKFASWGATLGLWLDSFNPGQYLVSTVVSWIAKLNLPNWDDITTKITDFKDTLGNVFENIKKALFDFISMITGGLVNLGGETTTNNNTQNNFIDINGNGKDDAEEILGFFGDVLKGNG